MSLPGPGGASLAAMGPLGALGSPDMGMAALPDGTGGPGPLDELRQKLKPAPQDRLARMVDLNEERTAMILRKWAAQEAAG
jgi:flagellar M-ring protein FliF